jgi:hypothetical protein
MAVYPYCTDSSLPGASDRQDSQLLSGHYFRLLFLFLALAGAVDEAVKAVDLPGSR